MKKKALCILLTIGLILGQASIAFAEETNTKSSHKNSVMPTSAQANLNRDCLINELGKKGFTIDSSPLDTKNDNRQLISINSIDDIDKLSNEIASLNNTKSDIKPSVYKKNNTSKQLFGTALAVQALATYSGHGTASKWAPLFGTFAWEKIYFNFQYTWYSLAGYYIMPYGTKPENLSSYLSGIHALVDWNQDGYSSARLSGGKDVTLHVDGHYRVGVVIFGGLPTYITTSGSWNITTDINDYL